MDRRSFAARAAALALLPGLPLRAQTVDEFGSAALRGAGSTFVHPLMSAWAREYRMLRKGGVALPLAGGGLDDEIGGVALDYEAVGSLAGIQRIQARAVDFAASEMPLPVADLRRHALLQVPLVAGAVAVAAHLDRGAVRELQLSPALLADIFLGRVSNWSDPALQRLNPGVPLPAAPIVVVHRADGSGTTFAFTAFLAQISNDWKARIGSDLLVKWPVGQGHEGNAGVARALQRTPHSIGYLNQVQTLDTSLVVARLQNGSGAFVAPLPAAVRAAVAAAKWDAAAGFEASLVNLPGPQTYPIAAAVFGLTARSGRRTAMPRAFLSWAVGDGSAMAEKLGYAALPAELAGSVRAALS